MTDDRYSRQVRFPGIGSQGQQRIRESRAAVMGCGALGSAAAEMLTRAGVGRLTLIDRDFVEPSNLQRQCLFDENDAAEALPKAEAARRRLSAVNSRVEIEARTADLVAGNVHPLLEGAQLIIDGSDNFEARYLLNDWAFQQGVPWVYGGCVASSGIGFAFRPGKTGCLQCLIPEPPPAGSLETCDTAGILAPAVHAVASFQVAEALKLLVGEEFESRLFRCDVWTGQWRCLPLPSSRREDCPCCGRREFRFLRARAADRTVRLCGRDAVQISPPGTHTVDFARLEAKLAPTARVRHNEFLMQIEVDGYDISLFPDGRSIIRGTDDPARARSIYARYVGR